MGNLDALRDWGYARDYVECMWLILQHETPEDFVIATGQMHSVREFCTLAFKEAGIEIEWQGKGVIKFVYPFCCKFFQIAEPTNPRWPATYILLPFSISHSSPLLLYQGGRD